MLEPMRIGIFNASKLCFLELGALGAPTLPVLGEAGAGGEPHRGPGARNVSR